MSIFSRLVASACVLFVSSLTSSSVFAFESRFAIDPTVNLAELSQSGQIVVKNSKSGGIYRSDASAVLSGVDWDKLAAASADFGHYVEMGMPNLRESRVVSRAGDVLHTWNHMSTSGQVSKHYLEVRLHPFGSEWQHVHKQAAWPYPEDSKFDRQDGSWYMERLPSGKIYVRYFLAADFDTGIPDFLVDLVARRALADGVRRVIQVLAKHGAITR